MDGRLPGAVGFTGYASSKGLPRVGHGAGSYQGICVGSRGVHSCKIGRCPRLTLLARLSGRGQPATAVRALQPSEGCQTAVISGGAAAGDGDGGVREVGWE